MVIHIFVALMLGEGVGDGGMMRGFFFFFSIFRFFDFPREYRTDATD